MKAAAQRLTVLICSAFLLVSCGEGVRQEYRYTRQTPAVGRKTPTVFVVRVAVDRSANTVVWAEDVHDSEGDLGRELQTWEHCTILDDSNWDCPAVVVPVQGEVNHVQMRDGNLTQRYWGESRNFQTVRRFAGLSF